MASVVAFIPARKNSKSVPNKNIRILGNKPLVAWSIETALSLGLRTVVSSDDETILKLIAPVLGAEVMVRPEEIAGDETSMYAVLKSEVPKITPKPDMILLLQPTSPFRKKEDIEKAIETLEKETDYDSLIAVEEVPEKYNPAQVMYNTPFGGRMVGGHPISSRKTRRQQFTKAYIPTGAIYLFRTENLENGSIYGDNVWLMKTEPTANINTLEDFQEAEKLCAQKS